MSYVSNRQLRTCLDVSLSRSDILVVLFQVLSEGIDIVLNKSATLSTEKNNICTEKIHVYIDFVSLKVITIT